MEQFDTEWAALRKELNVSEKEHDTYVHKLSEISNIQDSRLKAIKHLNYQISNLKEVLTNAENAAKTDEDREKIEAFKKEIAEARLRLKMMQSELPVENLGFYLSLILGHNLNLSILTANGRFKYKQDYESFKWKVTVTFLVWTVVAFLFPLRPIDSIGNFLMVWYYCTLTIRESILRINGSRIKGWWVAHHYISCALSGIVLIWKEGECYKAFRSQFIVFVAYIGLVQLLQNQYQQGTLRRLHALGKGHQMDVTLEGFNSNMFKGLTFLLPFLILGYFFQLYNAYTLWNLSYQCPGQWQVLALCYLFLTVACGNIFTTSLVIWKKFRNSGSYSNLLNITRNYRIRHKSQHSD
ncbi:unnamed protein product [Auanema sp. JU1783]|nr:unnamed protein product [Auanema sp. JU1783]